MTEAESIVVENKENKENQEEIAKEGDKIVEENDIKKTDEKGKEIEMKDITDENKSESKKLNETNNNSNNTQNTGEQEQKDDDKPVEKEKKKKRKKFKKPKNFARIKLEFQRLIKNAPWGISMTIKGDSLSEYIGTIQGPPDTPYENGTFYLNIKFTEDYPFQPPKITFKTRIYHCNVAGDGSICLDVLKDNWSPALNIDKVLLSIQSLMQTPNPHDPLVPEIAQMYLSNKKEHDALAKEWTIRHAGVDQN